jgi:peptidoglycan/LPS O-acetylase OafA/YrhL
VAGKERSEIMSQTLPESSENRILFLDNIRYLMVLFVIVIHAAVSYTNAGWWLVYDPKANAIIFTFIFFVIDTFAMPTLFFIAGYFALPNIEKKGTIVFLKDKFTRLGIPWLICVIFVAPVMDYINHYTHGYSSLSYGQFWLQWLQRATDFQTGFLFPKSPTQFNQFAYWFISLLLFFFIIFSLIYALKKRLFPSASFLSAKTHSAKTMLLIMLFVGLLCPVSVAIRAVIPFPYPDPWVSVGNILQFQLGRLFMYMIYFALGVWACGRGWFVKVNFPGKPFFWISICAILCFGFIITTSHLMADMTGDNNLMANFAKIDKRILLTFLFYYSFLRVIFLIVFTSFALHYWNRPHWINQTLASNSYDIYLVHMPIVLVFQLLLVNLTGTSSFIKFGIVVFSSIFLSYAIAQYALKDHPRLSVAAVLVVFLVMVIFVYPRA